MPCFAVCCMAAILGGNWKLAPRYMMPVLPVALYWLVVGGGAIGEWLAARGTFWTERRLRRVGWACVGLIMLVNAMRIGKIVRENRTVDFYGTADGGRVADYAPVCEWLRRNASPDDAVLAYEATTIHYFSRVRTVAPPHDTGQRGERWALRQVRREGARYVVRDERKDESTAVFDGLGLESRLRETPVLTSGRVTLSRIEIRGRNQR